MTTPSNNCDNCRHWRQFAHGPERGRGLCNIITPKKGRLIGPDEGPRAMACNDAGDHLAWLETAPDFGCSLWEDFVGNEV